MAIKRTLLQPTRRPGTGVSESDLCKIEEFIVRDKTGCIVHTVTPHNREIGLDDPRFRAKLTVKGEFLPEGGIKFPDGTTQTTAPTQGGGTITEIEDDDNGGIGVTNGTGPTVSLSIDVNNLVALGATIDTGDFVVIYDSDTASSKKALVSNLPFTDAQGTVTGIASSDSTITVTGTSSINIIVDESQLDNINIPNGAGYTTNTGTVTSVTAGDNTINSTGGTTPALNVVEANLTGIPAATAITGLATVATTGAASDVTGLATVATSGAAADVTGLATVATSGDYDDLSNKLAGGDGVDITTGTIAIDLATNPGLEFSNGELVLKTDATLSVGAGGASVVSTPGALTAALGGGFEISGGGSFNGSGDLQGSVDFGVTANDGTYTNASVTVSGNQVTNVTSGGGVVVVAWEEAFIKGYTVGDTTISSTVADADQELKWTTKMSSGGNPIAEGCVIEVNQGNNISLVATLTGGVITINNAGTYRVTATIDATHDNSNGAGNSTFSVWMSRTDQGALAEFAAGGNFMMPHGYNSMFQITGIAIFTGGTMSLHVGTTNENSANDKLTTGTLAIGQFSVTVSIEKIA